MKNPNIFNTFLHRLKSLSLSESSLNISSACVILTLVQVIGFLYGFIVSSHFRCFRLGSRRYTSQRHQIPYLTYHIFTHILSWFISLYWVFIIQKIFKIRSISFGAQSGSTMITVITVSPLLKLKWGKYENITFLQK